jgi:sulfate transport system permease protein
VVFISGNRVFETEITSFMIMNKLDQHDVAGATAIAMVMLVVSFVLLLAINLLQARSRRYMETS